MQTQYNNAAGRVLAHLQSALQSDDNDNTSAVWARVFSADIADPGQKIHQNNRPELYRRLAAMIEALDEIEAAMQFRHPTKLHLYNRDFPRLKQALSPPNITNTWAHYKADLTDAGLMALELCAEAMSVEGEVSQDDLNSILDAIHELRKLVLNSSELPKVLQEWILQLLNIVQRSVELYSIKGNRKLREALATLAGEIHFHEAEVAEFKKYPAVVEGFSKVFKALSFAVQKGKEIQTAIEYSGQVNDIIVRMLN